MRLIVNLEHLIASWVYTLSEAASILRNDILFNMYIWIY